MKTSSGRQARASRKTTLTGRPVSRHIAFISYPIALLFNFLADLFRRLFVDPAFGKSDSNGLRVGLPVPIHSLGRDLRPVVGAGRREPLAIGRVADEELA